VTVPADFTMPARRRLYWGLWRAEYRLKIKNPEAVRPTTTRAGWCWRPIQVKGQPARRCRKATALRTRGGRPGHGRRQAGRGRLVDGRPGPRSSPRPNGTGQAAAPDASRRRSSGRRRRCMSASRRDRHRRVERLHRARQPTRGSRRSSSSSWTPTATRRTTWSCRSRRRTSMFDARFEARRSDLAKARAWNMAGLRTGGRGGRHAERPRRRGQGVLGRDGRSPWPRCPAHRTRPGRRRRRLAREPVPVGLPEGRPAAAPARSRRRSCPTSTRSTASGAWPSSIRPRRSHVSAPPSAAPTAAQRTPAPASGAAVSAPATVVPRIAAQSAFIGEKVRRI
jgi:hypothetical protein